jgi:hypothetical protein
VVDALWCSFCVATFLERVPPEQVATRRFWRMRKFSRRQELLANPSGGCQWNYGIKQSQEFDDGAKRNFCARQNPGFRSPDQPDRLIFRFAYFPFALNTSSAK